MHVARKGMCTIKGFCALCTEPDQCWKGGQSWRVGVEEEGLLALNTWRRMGYRFAVQRKRAYQGRSAGKNKQKYPHREQVGEQRKDNRQQKRGTDKRTRETSGKSRTDISVVVSQLWFAKSR